VCLCVCVSLFAFLPVSALVCLWDLSATRSDREAMCRKKPKRPEVKANKQPQPAQTSIDHTMANCNLCFMSPKRNKNITLSVGCLAYLALPLRGHLVPGHCTIIPVDHVASMRDADSEVVEEVKNFKKCLIQMFQAQVYSFQRNFYSCCAILRQGVVEFYEVTATALLSH
jgi:hypothetical protein